MNDWPSTSRIPVRFAETDAMRFVYYANYFVYFEVARTDWLASVGLPYHQMEEQGCGVPVLEAHCEYLSPGHYGDILHILCRPELVDGLRIRFHYETRRNAPDGPLLNRGHTLHVCMDRHGKPRRPPRELLHHLPRASAPGQPSHPT